jgi:hypothetical protein
MAQPFCDRVDGCTLIEQPRAVRHPQIVQPDREAEGSGPLRKLFGDAVRMPGRVERAARGREHQPII